MAQQISAPGAEERQLLQLCETPCHVVVTCTPDLAATPTVRHDADGFYPHLIFVARQGRGRLHYDRRSVPKASTPQAGPSARSAFKMNCGAHYLPGPGFLYLTGGDTSGKWLVTVLLRELEEHRPHWHALSRVVQNGSAFALPDFHELVATPTTATWTLNTGAPLTTTPEPIHVGTCTLALTSAAPVVLNSAVYL